MSTLDEIEARIADCKTYKFGMRNADTLAHFDAPFLVAVVREQEAKLARVRALAEDWRYKGEFGWGAWQEGHGPDPEGYVLDSAASDIRKALEEAK